MVKRNALLSGLLRYYVIFFCSLFYKTKNYIQAFGTLLLKNNDWAVLFFPKGGGGGGGHLTSTLPKKGWESL